MDKKEKDMLTQKEFYELYLIGWVLIANAVLRRFKRN